MFIFTAKLVKVSNGLSENRWKMLVGGTELQSVEQCGKSCMAGYV